jgi:heptosyltransferase II
MKIAVRTPNWIGDVVFALPAIRSLEAHFPAADIRIAGPAWTSDLVAGTKLAGRTVPLEREALRREAFDAGVLLTNSFSSALLFRRAGIPERWGFRADGRGWLLTKGVRRRKAVPPIHMVRFYLSLIEGLGIPTLPPSIGLAAPADGLTWASRRLAGLGLRPDRPLVVVAPGAAHGPAKRWPAPRFAEASRLLMERRGAAVAVVGAASDAPLAAEILAALPAPAADLTGQTGLGELLGVFSLASVVLSNDSGPLHMANALRAPAVAVFGPTDPRATGPFHAPSRVLRREDVPCWPCEHRACPYDHRCMTGIGAEDAAAAAEEILR